MDLLSPLVLFFQFIVSNERQQLKPKRWYFVKLIKDNTLFQEIPLGPHNSIWLIHFFMNTAMFGIKGMLDALFSNVVKWFRRGWMQPSTWWSEWLLRFHEDWLYNAHKIPYLLHRCKIWHLAELEANIWMLLIKGAYGKLYCKASSDKNK